MPNQYQLAFLASFFVTLASLIASLHFAVAFFRSKGYDIGDLILIGLDKKNPNPTDGRVEIEKIPAIIMEFVKNADLDDIVQLATSPTVLVTAGIVLATAVYVKLFHTGRTAPLDPLNWKEFPLLKTTKVSPNTAIYRFKLPHQRDVLGLPIGQHISVSAEINGKTIVRNYTPVSLDDDRGFFDLLIKTYEKGNISRYVTTLNPGDKLRVKGPKGNFKYSPNLVGHLSMIAGGTGIAPMIQIIRGVLRNPLDQTTLTLIYANVNEEDILLRAELEELLDVHGEQRFKIFYVLNNPPVGWKGGAGFVTKEHIKELLPNPAETNSKILICGPPPMVNAMKKNLDELKYPLPNTISKLQDKVFVF
ncbi:NADH-cytochrome b5 reductase [Coprinopsis cinerea okayama7|uniref:NADH-cytochrome b5 reductase n=1 Tax=Coprinopsis cinerea (strain Okayama-7 / 130 / ATCC MYA-4618 / FGSC 9003) TaxID=240176 RepID=A8N1Y9_COPC7|nr:NADH-cytochrome b5 reductase [Coprinopsis cinerea okayama7\|eukprot:XP_001828888.1 NADH-cytochrome b5 reductase [Coprinopsis cinerea okayama7\